MFDAIVRNGILMTVVALIICVIGVLAAFRVPVQMIPDLEVRTVSVRTAWPGATPQDVEKEILIEQEEYLRTLPNLQRLESTASRGSAVIDRPVRVPLPSTEGVFDIFDDQRNIVKFVRFPDETQKTYSFARGEETFDVTF